MESVDELRRVLKIDSELEDSGMKTKFIRSVSLPKDIKLVKDFGAGKELPKPKPETLKTSLWSTIKSRRSCRVFDPEGRLDLEQLSALLYSAAGVTLRVDGVYGMLDYPFRATPSTGGLHCIDLYVAALRVNNLSPGLYYYHYDRHELSTLCEDCYPHTLVDTIAQGQLRNAPVYFILVAKLRRGIWKYGCKFYKLCLVDAGCVAEHVHLASTAMNLCSVLVAGFNVERVKEILDLEEDEIPVLIIPVGPKI